MNELVLRGHSQLRPVRSWVGPRSQRRRVSIALWLPLTPVLALLAPLIMLGAPLALLSRSGRRARPVASALRVGAALLSLSGLSVEVDAPGVKVRLRIV